MTAPLIPPNAIPMGIVPMDLVQGTNAAGVSPPGNLRVEQPLVQVFWDAFNTGTLDTAIRWLATAGGTGTAPTSVQGDTVLTGGTTLNSFSRLQSQPVFQPSQPGYLVCKQNNNFEFPLIGGSYRFWGLGNVPATPTIATPVTDGVGFEISTTGIMSVVTYAAGARTLIQNLGAKSQGGSGVAPGDANPHKYWIYFAGDMGYFCIDSPDNVVASFLTGAPGPANNILGTCAVVVSNAGAAASITVNAASVADNSHSSVSISDGTYGFRKGSVNSGAQNVANCSSYTAITTNGTTTVANGAGIYYGSYLWAVGTAAALVSALDGTNTIAAVGTGSAANSFVSPLPAGLGVKFTTSLVIVTSGTAGSWNVLWD